MSDHITIVVPGYNNIKWYKKNIDSINAQIYNNFNAIYMDDCSTDGTANKVANYVSDIKNITFVRNQNRVGALQNLYTMIHSCDDDDVIVTLDADDWLHNPNVLSRVAREYDNNTLLTYGQYIEHPSGTLGCSRQIPQNIIDNASYRQSGWYSSHLRTFKAKLFKSIKKEDLMHGGKFFASAWDLAMMFPMLEMAGNRAKFISDILYVYNMANPLNDHKIDPKQQQSFARIIRQRPKYHQL